MIAVATPPELDRELSELIDLALVESYQRKRTR
jgi:hypothetical protein